MTVSVNSKVSGANYLGTSTDSNGNTVLDTSSSAALAASGVLPPLAGGVCLSVGDSTSANGFIPSNDNSTTAQMLHGQAFAELGAPFDKFVNGGVSGENTQEILARVPDLLEANNPTVVIFGPNSVNDYDDTFTSTQTLSYISQAVALCVAYPGVVKTYVQTIQPTDSQNMETAGGARGRKWHAEVQDGLRSLVTQYCGAVELIDTFSIVAAANASGMISGYSPDGTHFGYRASERTSTKGFKPAATKLKFANTWKRPYTTVDHRNILGPFASAPAGSNASGTAGTVLLTGTTGTLPNGWTGRRAVGDTTATATVSTVANPHGYAASSASAECTLGADGGAIGVSVGRAASVRNNYDNERANSQAYTYNDKIVISATLNGQVFAAGTSAASAPDFTGVVPGDMVTDGTVVWLVTLRPLPGSIIEVAADLDLQSLTGSGQTYCWLSITNDAAVSVDRYLNYAGTGTYSYPTLVDSARRMYRQRFTIPTTSWASVKTMQLAAFFCGKNAATATMLAHGLSIEVITQ